jgi:hypothetical protein
MNILTGNGKAQSKQKNYALLGEVVSSDVQKIFFII